MHPRARTIDAFNFAFSLFGIILGLSLVEVLTGFPRALRRRWVTIDGREVEVQFLSNAD